MKVEIITEKVNAGVLLKLKGDVDMNTSSDVRNSLAAVFKQASPAMKAILSIVAATTLWASVAAAQDQPAGERCSALPATQR